MTADGLSRADCSSTWPRERRSPWSSALMQTQLGAWTWLAAVLLGAALAVRRVAPFVMVALAVAASLVQVVSGNVAWLACVAYVPLFVTLGGHRDVRVRRLGLACAAVAVVVAAGWEWAQLADERLAAGPRPRQRWPWRPRRPWWSSARGSSDTCGGSDDRRSRRGPTRHCRTVERRRLHDLYEQEQERSRIAADMHDLVAHSWAVVAAQADGARYLVRDRPRPRAAGAGGHRRHGPLGDGRRTRPARPAARPAAARARASGSSSRTLWSRGCGTSGMDAAARPAAAARRPPGCST